MAIKRFDLIHAIEYAQKSNESHIYNELLDIYYRMLAQEEIQDIYMEEFTTYDVISEEVMALLSSQVMA